MFRMILVPMDTDDVSADILSAVNAVKPAMESLEEAGGDLLAMTSHGRSGVSRWLFDSVAEKVLRSCSAPMLFLRNSGGGDGR